MWNSSKKNFYFCTPCYSQNYYSFISTTQKPSNLISFDECAPKIRWQKVFQHANEFSWFEQKIYVTRKNKFNRTTEKCTFSSIPSHKINGKIDRIRNGYNIFEKKAQHINRNRSESDPKNQMCAIHTRRDLNWIESRYTIEWRPNKLRTSNLIVRANALLLHRWINPWFHQRHGEAYTRSYTHRWCLPIHRNVPFSAVIVYTHLLL